LDWLRTSAAATGFLAATAATTTGLLAAATTTGIPTTTAAARTLATATTLTAAATAATGPLAAATTTTWTLTAAAAPGPLAAATATTALTGFLLTFVTDVGVVAHLRSLLSLRSMGKKQADPLSSVRSTDCEGWLQRGLRLTSKDAYFITSCRR
jgi:hypothetical protein